MVIFLYIWFYFNLHSRIWVFVIVVLLVSLKRSGERAWERNIGVKGKHWSVASHICPDQGLNPWPWYVPWPESNPQPFLVNRIMLQTTEPSSQGLNIYLFFWPLYFKENYRDLDILPWYTLVCISKKGCFYARTKLFI